MQPYAMPLQPVCHQKKYCQNKNGLGVKPQCLQSKNLCSSKCEYSELIRKKDKKDKKLKGKYRLCDGKFWGFATARN